VEADRGFVLQLALWLWFTVLFANFAEAVAEGRGKAQADSLRKARTETFARRLLDGREERIPHPTSSKGDLVVCEAGDLIPADGEVIEGIASVDESAITGESAPVVREAAATAAPSPAAPGALRPHRRPHHLRAGRHLLDRMIAMVEGAIAPEDAERDRAHHPALGAHADLPARLRHAEAASAPTPASPSPSPTLIALLVCLIPTTIGGLLSAIGIAAWTGCSPQRARHLGRAVEAAGDIDVLLLDKTGTITLGNRRPATSIRRRASPADGSPTRRSSRRSPTKPPRAAASSSSPRKIRLRGREVAAARTLRALHRPDPHERRRLLRRQPPRARSARARPDIRPGLVLESRRNLARRVARPSTPSPARAARRSSSPTAAEVLGVIHLKDVVKGGIKERFAQLRAMGIARS
jgi:K+-transporting ATPase ATPase B chain